MTKKRRAIYRQYALAKGVDDVFGSVFHSFCACMPADTIAKSEALAMMFGVQRLEIVFSVGMIVGGIGISVCGLKTKLPCAVCLHYWAFLVCWSLCQTCEHLLVLIVCRVASNLQHTNHDRLQTNIDPRHVGRVFGVYDIGLQCRFRWSFLALWPTRFPLKSCSLQQAQSLHLAELRLSCLNL